MSNQEIEAVETKGKKPKKILKVPMKTANIDLPPEVIQQCNALVPQSARDQVARIGQVGVSKEQSYTPVTVGAILRNLARGLPQESAATLAGVAKKQWWDWKVKHPDLQDSVSRAQALCEEQLLTVVRGGFAKNPRLALEVLERRFASWSQKRDVQVSGNVDYTAYTLENFRALAQSRAQRDGLTIDVDSVQPASTTSDGLDS